MVEPQYTKYHHLLNGNSGGYLVKFTPPEDIRDIENLEKWKLSFDIDQCNGPEFKEQVRKDIAKRVKKLFVSNKVDTLLGGSWILLNGAEVQSIINANIMYMLGSSQIMNLVDSNVGKMLDTSRVWRASESSLIRVMRDKSSIFNMYNFSQVLKMYDDSGIVGNMFDKTKIWDMNDRSFVENMDPGVVVEHINSAACRVGRNRVLDFGCGTDGEGCTGKGKLRCRG